ncbi:class E sortase [Streptomyces sp. A7024]|uniref:Class E sortase n=1 Tax=Streptomyces coryli TaxID=1128680 RepID=A0A6G4TVX0_9ACTN|nr:class E sortase [Streptomyces coryli]
MTLRIVVRTFSEICVTVGTLIVLLVVYVLYWTGIRADSAMDDQMDTLTKRWATEDKDPGSTQNAAAEAGPPEALHDDRSYEGGKPFAVMYIPRFGADWRRPVLQGTGVGTLKKGLGHYAGTAALGGEGNFAVAGHRRTYGDPFKDFPRLRSGDVVVVNDGRAWYTYKISSRPYKTLPDDTGVLKPLPKPLDPGAAPYDRPGRYLTLTTCEPEWGSSHRLITWAHLDEVKAASEGKPAVLGGAGG